jgi:hypothetical protein
LRQRGGRVVTAAGEAVMLCPDHPIDREINQTLASGRPFARSPDVRAFLATCRQTRAGSTGNFTFRNVPSGNFSVSTQVRWEVPGSYIPQGGFIYSVISVKDGEETNVIITR